MPSISTIILPLLFLLTATTTVLAAPKPPANFPILDIQSQSAEATAHMQSALREAESLGIDIHGPIPTDYTSFDATTGRYDFPAGSHASLWARAQLALGSLPGNNPTPGNALQKRNSGVGMGMWHGTWCSGAGWYIANVVYGLTYTNPTTPYVSVGISGRTLGDWEQLDFSTWTTCPTHGCSPVSCGQYLYSAAHWTPPGCWNSMNYHCAKLWTY